MPDLPVLLAQLAASPEWEALLRIVVAGAVAVLVGIEREREGKPAGARTYGLVAMGAAIFTVVGIYGMGAGDPASRIAAQIVTGIGFIGAGTILHMRRRVVGLTTAAGMWVAAGVGMAIGSGLYIIGIGAGIALFVLLQFLRPDWLRGSSLSREARDDELEEAE
jgi:putative Mg2+ transporter-C (MgtC) family protein